MKVKPKARDTFHFTMPLFGKKSDKSKSPSSPKEGDGGKASSSKKVPTVEDKYHMKDVLGT